jgi:hypothetical protein
VTQLAHEWLRDRAPPRDLAVARSLDSASVQQVSGKDACESQHKVEPWHVCCPRTRYRIRESVGAFHLVMPEVQARAATGWVYAPRSARITQFGARDRSALHYVQ